MDAWNTLQSLSNAVGSAGTEAARTAAYMRVLGLDANGADNPAFDNYLDATNYVDYLMTNFYGGNVDWPHRNWYASRRQGPETQGFVFHNWDYETTLGLTTDVNVNRLGVADGAAAPYNQLKTSLEFRVLFGDRVHRAFFNNGALTSQNSVARYQEIAGELTQAIVAESARWGDMHSTTNPYNKTQWQAEVTRVTNFLVARESVFLNQLRSAGLYSNVVAPTFNQFGGQVPAGFQLTMSAPAGAIWYTLDGSDPRLIGGGVNPAAIQYTGSVTLNSSTQVKARVLNGSTWSALTDADFAGPYQVRISELHYNPAAHPGVIDRQDLEFIELFNAGSTSVSLNGVQIGGFADEAYTFSNGLNLAPGQRIVVARNPVVFQSVYGTGVNLAPTGYSDRSLSNSGEQVTLLGPAGEELQDFAYSDLSPWPGAADGNGASLEIVDPLGDPESPANWRASLSVGGSPGSEGLPTGDFDGDGDVDGIDLGRWRTGFGTATAATRGLGDADGDHDVDGGDFLLWQRNLGSTSGAALASAGAVSESQLKSSTMTVNSSTMTAEAAGQLAAWRPQWDADADRAARSQARRTVTDAIWAQWSSGERQASGAIRSDQSSATPIAAAWWTPSAPPERRLGDAIGSSEEVIPAYESSEKCLDAAWAEFGNARL